MHSYFKIVVQIKHQVQRLLNAILARGVQTLVKPLGFLRFTLMFQNHFKKQVTKNSKIFIITIQFPTYSGLVSFRQQFLVHIFNENFPKIKELAIKKENQIYNSLCSKSSSWWQVGYILICQKLVHVGQFHVVVVTCDQF